MKLCSKCKEEKDDNCFSKGRRECKPCRVIKQGEYAAKNKNKIAAYQREYSASHVEEKAAYMKKYNTDNSEKFRLYREKNKHRDRITRLEYNRKNKEKIAAKYSIYREANKEKIAASNLAYRTAHKDRLKAIRRKYCVDNSDKIAALASKKRAAKLQRTPAWAHKHLIDRHYGYAKIMTDATGIEYHVDHIVPLRGENVSGLHVHNNLQVITATENLKKHNSWEP